MVHLETIPNHGRCSDSSLVHVHFLLTTISLSILIILAVLSHADLRLFLAQPTANRIEHQITSVVLLQAISATCLLPYTVNIFHATITQYVVKCSAQVAVENESLIMLLDSTCIEWSLPCLLYTSPSPRD